MTRGERVFVGSLAAIEISLAVWNASLQFQLAETRAGNIALTQKLSKRTATLQTQITETNSRIDSVLAIPVVAQSKEKKSLEECMAEFNRFYRTNMSEDAQEKCSGHVADRKT